MNCSVHVDRPAARPCDRCGTFSCGECLAPVGAQMHCAACRQRSSLLEWDQRAELGIFRAWWLTTKRILMSPMQTFDVVPGRGTLVDSSLYAGISAVVGFAPSLFVYLVIIGFAMALGPGMKDAKIGMAAGVGIGIGAVLFYGVLLIGMTIASVLLFSALELLVLRLTGVKHAGYDEAVRAHALSMASYAIGIVPICGLYVFPIYALVLRIFAIQRMQKVTTGQAAASALIPIGFCCFVGGVSYVGLIAAFAAIGGRR